MILINYSSFILWFYISWSLKVYFSYSAILAYNFTFHNSLFFLEPVDLPPAPQPPKPTLSKDSALYFDVRVYNSMEWKQLSPRKNIWSRAEKHTHTTFACDCNQTRDLSSRQTIVPKNWLSIHAYQSNVIKTLAFLSVFSSDATVSPMVYVMTLMDLQAAWPTSYPI